jgi:hypothetical protein
MNFGDPLMAWIENYIGNKGQTLTGGSVATSVFDLAHKLGSSPIILAGQDLSFPNGRAYVEWCHFDQTWLDDVSKYETINDFHYSKISRDGNHYEKGLFGNKIHSSLKMRNWKCWFETMINHHGIHCVNSTEDGLVIQGVEHLPLREAISKYCVKSVHVKDIINEIKSKYQATDIPTFIEHLKELKSKVGRVGYITKEGKSVSSIVLGISESSPSRKLKLKSYFQKMSIFAEQILSEQEFIEINKWCIEVLMDKMKIEARTYEKNNEKNRDETSLLLQSIRSYNILFEGIDEMCSHYDNELDYTIEELNKIAR